jgi:hypothetical protein
MVNKVQVYQVIIEPREDSLIDNSSSRDAECTGHRIEIE